ncbi:PDZ domain-containing protein [Candidatus Parcubacteria bacterium]|nr:PDZ domain-containing protein [Patescibacteria group bacterium]MBU4309078.1 PDZ domain-containing protein [Patescibacteria group bacterium]MBU4432456.1 PDZ domain-containing protein [Patescibacteria group bacterium]MBU4577439.1 PDZ domain-containing protein [Patescibacteria group bacterium]MCG2697127.1 PDZ domain-containing protein [Candidatus Parcubacteria bacterium]
MNNKLIIIILIAVFFGLSGGVVGQIISRTYLMDNAFNIPMLGDINIRNSVVDGKNLVISNPSKVVVEQNEKIIETSNSVKNGIVGVFKKIATSTPNNNNFSMADYYKVDNVLGQGFVITSDGWVMSGYLPKEIVEDKKKTASTTKELFDTYVIITKDKKIFNVENIVIDKDLAYSFWKVNAKDLPVHVFVSNNDIANGQMVMAVNWNESVWVSTIISKSDKKDNAITSSDDYFKKITLASNPNPIFHGSFLFDLSGNLLAFINNDGSVGFIGNYISCINCLLDKSLIKKSSLGVNYINLSALVKSVDNKYPENGALITANEKGIAIKKSSPADIAKLKIGDIIISINGVNIDKNNQLNDMIGGYKPGQVIDVIYLRNDKRENVSIILGELN